MKKRTTRKLALHRETLRNLEQQSLSKVAGRLIPSENPQNPCNWTEGGTCGEWTCLGCWTDETAC
ncbi:MAG: hypothetical protein QOH06_221 [Acidobacteriota bacterium]|jgi:hypothetical protein|nr:hypothetical protein [Acidobacteriota bacterium]